MTLTNTITNFVIISMIIFVFAKAFNLPNTLIAVSVAVVLVVLLIFYFYDTQKIVLSGINDASKQYVVSASNLTSNGSGTVNFTYSSWIFVNDWSYKYGYYKTILARPSSMNITGTNNMLYSILINLDKQLNNVIVNIGDIDGSKPIDIVAPNVPLQAWTNITVSVNNRLVDVYINGKLVTTTYINNTAIGNVEKDLYITPLSTSSPNEQIPDAVNYGFSGYISNVQYYPEHINPQTAWYIYTNGPSNLWFPTYSIDLSVYDPKGDKLASIST